MNFGFCAERCNPEESSSQSQPISEKRGIIKLGARLESRPSTRFPLPLLYVAVYSFVSSSKAQTSV